MATVTKWTPFGVALNVTATGGTVTRTSATKFTVKINASWETYWDNNQTNYGMTASSGGSSVTLNPFGTKAHSGSGSFTGTYSISGNGAATKTITVTFRNFNNDNGDSATKNVTFSVSVPAWTSYTIKYNANGGSGAPGNQTKWKDQALTLSTTKPTRTGYSFLGWSTSSTATSATYSAGGKYTANAAATLYAVWKANTYTVTFNANGGTGAPAKQTKTYGVNLTLSSTKPTRANYTFLGWGTSSTATAVTYAAGATYKNNASITLYAIWQLSYKKPRITNFSIRRCTEGGVPSDDGTYAIVIFSWECDKAVQAIEINWKASGDADWTTITAEASGTSGQYAQIVCDGALSPDSSYDFYITVTDEGGYFYKNATLGGSVFPVDLLPESKGIAFGKSAEKEGYADFGYKGYFRKGQDLAHNQVISGTNPDGTIVEALNPQNANGNTVIGYGNYDRGAGSTNIYGYDILYGISNIATPGTYKPYLRRGDSFTITFRGSGYVTNAGKDISFWLPLTVPVIGSPTVTAASGNGFVLRQGDKYTHGSAASTNVTPDSYEVVNYYRSGLYIKAVFSNTTNVTNNDAIGIYWHGTITFS